ncbi:diacylglycerol kinase family protein [Pedobacter sp. SYP-B3415]|uniref:diacylglycerol/lipid kinase family protein n=1 Tax=Pedobacter sp. SYP-B3415 TaxID=2496641 RepID=UPI0013ED7938|nr:diacylglycerol kinase family protein [Pedobacter sp. SYP-B3415]
MRKAIILHNPNAGDDKHSEENLKKMMRAAGYEASYESLEDDSWVSSADEDKLIVIAGGDGTVRSVVTELLEANAGRVLKFAVVPAGTANNIAKTLGAPDSMEEDPARFSSCQPFDLGRITGVSDQSFFLESFGIGVFPALMKKMSEGEHEEISDPDEKIRRAHELLEEIIADFEPVYCEFDIDGSVHSGKFFMVEIMNIRSIGPNLAINPLADPGDGEFEVVLIPEAQKEKLLDYNRSLLTGEKKSQYFDTCKAKNIKMSFKGNAAHLDDELLEPTESQKITIYVEPHKFEFLT